MKFKEKWKQITVKIVLIISLFIAVVPSYSYGISIGGVLMKPLCSFITNTVDSINLVISVAFGGTSTIDAIKTHLETDWTPIADAFDAILKKDDGLDDEDKKLFNAFFSPEDVFLGKSPLGNVNIFKTTDWEEDESNAFNTANTINNVKEQIGKYYIIIRNIAISLSLCMLIYTGIKILLSTIEAPEKGAREKMYLMEWLKSLGLILTMHIIMAGVFWIADSLVDMFGNSFNNGLEMVGNIRYNIKKSYDTNQIVYLILYVYLTYMSVCFLISYGKRFLWTLVLIIVSPIIGLVYALSKEGKSTFEMWFKEFIYNALLPVYHTITYTAFISIIAGSSASGGGLGFDRNRPNYICPFCFIIYE